MTTHSSAAALSLLASEAREARSDPIKSEAALLQALEMAPEDEQVRLGAYRFYFYNHRYAEALPHAEALIASAARRLNCPTDWRAVRPEDAPFTEAEFAPGMLLQCLIAWGYCHLRLGDMDEARAAMAQCALLDPTDRFGAAAILGHIEAREAGEED